MWREEAGGVGLLGAYSSVPSFHSCENNSSGPPSLYPSTPRLPSSLLLQSISTTPDDLPFQQTLVN